MLEIILSHDNYQEAWILISVKFTTVLFDTEDTNIWKWKMVELVSMIKPLFSSTIFISCQKVLCVCSCIHHLNIGKCLNLFCIFFDTSNWWEVDCFLWNGIFLSIVDFPYTKVQWIYCMGTMEKRPFFLFFSSLVQVQLSFFQSNWWHLKHKIKLIWPLLSVILIPKHWNQFYQLPAQIQLIPLPPSFLRSGLVWTKKACDG